MYAPPQARGAGYRPVRKMSKQGKRADNDQRIEWIVDEIGVLPAVGVDESGIGTQRRAANQGDRYRSGGRHAWWPLDKNMPGEKIARVRQPQHEKGMVGRAAAVGQRCCQSVNRRDRENQAPVAVMVAWLLAATKDLSNGVTAYKPMSM